MARHHYRESDPVEEILRIAMQNEGGPDVALRQRLLASAAELGISEDAVLKAEKQWHAQKKKEEELDEYRAHTLRSLYTHLGVYVVVNVFLVLMNMLTEHGRVDWAFWPILGWGIGLGCHLVAAVVQLKNPGGEEFQEWRKEVSSQRQEQPGLSVPMSAAGHEPFADTNQTHHR
jgi:hypothetical protein